MEPSLAAAHLWRANGHLRLDQFQDALEHYGIALRLYGEQHAVAVRASAPHSIFVWHLIELTPAVAVWHQGGAALRSRVEAHVV